MWLLIVEVDAFTFTIPLTIIIKLRSALVVFRVAIQ
jgi:hypothetical protein